MKRLGYLFLLLLVLMFAGCGGGGSDSGGTATDLSPGGGAGGGGDPTAVTVDLIDIKDFFGGELIATGADPGGTRSSGLIRATVTDTGGVALANQTITFNATAGGFTPSATVTTGDDGVAQVFYVAPATLAKPTISAVGGGVLSNILSVNITNGPAATLTLYSSSLSLGPGGSATLSVLAQDALGFPVPDEFVVFEFVTEGSGKSVLASRFGTTNASGATSVAYEAGSLPALTTTVTDQLRARAGAVLSNTLDITITEAATFLKSITLQAVRNVQQVDNGFIPNAITAVLTDSSGAAPNTPIPVTFITSLGTLKDAAGNTGQQLTINSDTNTGFATLNLLTETVTGQAQVVAFTGGFPSNPVSVDFKPGNPDSVVVSSFPTTVQPGGAAQIRATVVDAYGNPVVGETVSFSITTAGSGLPSLPASAVTDGIGVATANYVAGFTATAAGVTDAIRATANTNNLSGTGSMTVQTGAATIKGIDLITGAFGTPGIIANGANKVLLRATVTNTDGTPAASQSVTFSTTLGTITSATVLTGSDGLAQTYLTAPTVTGSANVTANVSGFVDTDTVDFIPGPPKIIALKFLPVTVAPGASSTLTATVTDINNNPVVAETVNFSVQNDNSQGAALSSFSEATNPNGQAFVTYTAGITSATDTIGARAQSNALYNSALIVVSSVTAGAVGSINLVTGSTTMIADGGNSSVVLRATVNDTAGNPAPGRTVTFVTTSGGLYNSVQTVAPSPAAYVTTTTKNTDADGIAEAYLYSPTSLGSAALSAVAGGFVANAGIQFTPGPVASVTMLASPNQVGAGGQTTISATVLDANGNPVENESIQFFFDTTLYNSASQPGYNSTTFSGGVLQNIVGITDVNGRVSVGYTAGSQGDESTATYDVVSAKTTNSTQGDVRVDVKQSAANIASLVISTPQSSVQITQDAITLDPNSSALIQATVVGTDGLPKAGVDVLFTTTQGTFGSYNSATIQDTAQTDAFGVASIQLYSGRKPSVAYVTAAIGGFNGALQITFTPGGPKLATITANPSTIPADGTTESTITVFLADVFGNPILDGTEVTLNTDNGTIIAPNVSATVSGRSEFALQAPSKQGTATLSIDLVDSASGTVTFGAQPPGDPANILLAVVDTQLSVAGVGQQENTTVTVTITDAEGNPIDESLYNSATVNNLRVKFITSPNGGEFMTGTDYTGTPQTVSSGGTMDIRTHDGIASLNLQSGVLPGVMEISFEALLDVWGNPALNPIISALPQVVIASGPPHSIVLTSPITNSVENLGGGVYRRVGKIIVTDRHGNSVPDGTAINLGLMDSIIAEGTSGISDSTAGMTFNTNGSLTLSDGTPTDLNNATISRNANDRYIQGNDRLLIFNTRAEDKLRFVREDASGLLANALGDILNIQTAHNYNSTSLSFAIGAALLGGEVSGIDTAGNLATGSAYTKDGLASFRVTYPANNESIMNGCNPAFDTRFDTNSARTFVTASTSDDSATTISKDGQFCFAPIAGFTLTALPSAFTSSATLGLTLEDGGDTVPVPFYRVNVAVTQIKTGTFDACIVDQYNPATTIYNTTINPTPANQKAACENAGLSWYARSGYCVNTLVQDGTACAASTRAGESWTWVQNLASAFAVDIYVGDYASIEPATVAHCPSDMVSAFIAMEDTDEDGSDDFCSYPVTREGGTTSSRVEVRGGNFIVSGDTATILYYAGDGETTVTITVP
ncbi:MAG: Ig-like domain-containing protein [Desulfuromonadales bacterium]|nr:Ig-like domain-containing protein [Desulfuromonadales bacterium]